MGQGLLPNPIGAISGYVANKRNRRATREATEEAMKQLDTMHRNQQNAQRAGQFANERFQEDALGLLGQAQQDAFLQMRRGDGQALSMMHDATGQSMDFLQQGVQQGQQTLQDAMGSVDLSAPIEADAGFRFQQEQGERAIGALASSQGGFGGGAQLKELARFNQGLAATHAQDVFNRRFAQRGQNLGAAQNLANLQFGGGSALAGQTMSNASQLGGLHRDIGLTRSNQTLANAGAQLNIMGTAHQNLLNSINNMTNIHGQNAALRTSLITGQAAGAGMGPLIAAQGLGGDLNELVGVAGGLVGAAAGKAGL